MFKCDKMQKEGNLNKINLTPHLSQFKFEIRMQTLLMVNQCPS